MLARGRLTLVNVDLTVLVHEARGTDTLVAGHPVHARRVVLARRRRAVVLVVGARVICHVGDIVSTTCVTMQYKLYV